MHYLIFRKVSLSPLFLLCSFATARPSGMRWITKWTNLSIQKQMGVKVGDTAKWKYVSRSYGTFASPLRLPPPFIYKAESEKEEFTIQKHWAV